MRKGILVLALVLIVVAFIFAEEVKPDYVLRFNTVAAPAQPQVLAMKKFAEIVEELSGGKIKVEVYHSGQLGDQKTALLAVILVECQNSASSKQHTFLKILTICIVS